jgi:hypothetical protein
MTKFKLKAYEIEFFNDISKKCLDFGKKCMNFLLEFKFHTNLIITHLKYYNKLKNLNFLIV